jgi:DNA-3-methyladenine glycosylase
VVLARELARAFESPLPRAFYDRGAERLAPALLGCLLIRRAGRSLRAVRIVETEAYIPDDPASHAFHGPTPRNRSMYAGAGTLYVFRIHQVHCANAVARPGEAVLLRAGEPLGTDLADPSGPGRLCRALDIDGSEDGLDLIGSRKVRIAPAQAPVGSIVTAPRVGISKAKERKLRFMLEGNRWVSSPRPWGRARPSRVT